MSSATYRLGLDVLGAHKIPRGKRAILVRRTDVFGVDKAVLIHLSDIASTVRQQGGAKGGIAYAVAPDTVTAAAYSKMAAKIRDSMKNEDVPATVEVIDMPGAIKNTSSGILRDVFIGIGVAGIVELAMHFVKKRM